jgi:hypothetical protein
VISPATWIGPTLFHHQGHQDHQVYGPLDGGPHGAKRKSSSLASLVVKFRLRQDHWPSEAFHDLDPGIRRDERLKR